MTDKIDAYWFAASDRLPHSDNRPIVVGGTHSLSGKIVICKHALHASRDPFDALQYAPGPYLYKVRCWGDVVEQGDKLGARHREYVAMRDATEMLRRFAREQALSVIHFWDASGVVRRYLETGDEAIRADAWSAAGSAARAAEAAAWSAAWSAAGSAARAAARAAEAAAWRAAARTAGSAAGSAARTAGSAARSASKKRFNALVDDLFAKADDA